MPFARLQFLKRDAGKGVDQLSPCRTRNDVAELPYADAASRNVDAFCNGLCAEGAYDFRMRHVSTLLAVITGRKHNITLGHGTAGNVWRMKARWQDTEGTWDRLRWARMRWQEASGLSPNAEAAAESLGIKAGTYRAYERQPGSSKHIPLDHQTAARFAKKFNVNWTWLLTGEGSPDASDDHLTPIERRMIDALREAPEARQAAAADAIIQLLKIA